MNRLVTALVVVVVAAISAFVAIGPANPLADDLAAANEETQAAEQQRDEHRDNLAAAYASIDDRADRERGHLATIVEQSTTIDQQTATIDRQAEDLDTARADIDRLREQNKQVREERVEAELALAEQQSRAEGLEADLDAAKDNVAALERQLAEKRVQIENSDDICVVTYCTEEQAFGVDFLMEVGSWWYDEWGAEAKIAELSRHFGVPAPSVNFGGDLGSNIDGAYYPATGEIEFAGWGSVSEWTLAHEFAHHLECHTGGACVGHHHDGFIESMRDVLTALGW